MIRVFKTYLERSVDALPSPRQDQLYEMVESVREVLDTDSSLADYVLWMIICERGVIETNTLCLEA